MCPVIEINSSSAWNKNRALRIYLTQEKISNKPINEPQVGFQHRKSVDKDKFTQNFKAPDILNRKL